MMQPGNADQEARKRNGKSGPSPARKIGYVVVIIIMFVILYLVRNYEKWNLNFLTEDFSRCLFYIELSIYINIAANVLFIFYDNRWFKFIVQAVSDVAGALVMIMFYVIYPLNLADATWNKWIRIGLLVVFGLTILSAMINLVKGIRYLVREPERV